MEFDSFTVVLLALREDAPEMDDEASGALQDAHLAYLARLHQQGHLLAAGPLGHGEYRGLSILRGDPDTVRALKQADPAVQAGVYDLVVMPWRVPAGAARFAPTFFPSSMADVQG